MKKILLLTAFSITSACLANAQIPKGSTWVGGFLGYNSSENQSEAGSRQDGYSISPAIGTAIKQNIIAGIELNFNHGKFKYSANSEQNNTNYGGGLFLRKYWNIISRLYVYGHGALDYNNYKQKYKFSSTYEKEIKGSAIELNIHPGLAFSINKKWQLETGFNNLFNVSYGRSKSEVLENSIKSSFKGKSFAAGANLENGSSLYIGFRLLVSK